MTDTYIDCINKLYNDIKAYYQNEWGYIDPKSEIYKILNQYYCELEAGYFLGFVEQYEALAKIIPLDYKILDLGCYLAPQAYYFRDHEKYIGIDDCELERFKFKNTEHHIMDIKDYLVSNNIDDSYFIISNYVPMNKVRADYIKSFSRNVFMFYPTIPRKR